MEEFLPPTWLTKQFGQYVCGSTEFVGSMVCANTLFMIAGPSSLQLNNVRSLSDHDGYLCYADSRLVYQSILRTLQLALRAELSYIWAKWSRMAALGSMIMDRQRTSVAINQWVTASLADSLCMDVWALSPCGDEHRLVGTTRQVVALGGLPLTLCQVRWASVSLRLSWAGRSWRASSRLVKGW
jgi:hypothetical protein